MGALKTFKAGDSLFKSEPKPIKTGSKILPFGVEKKHLNKKMAFNFTCMVDDIEKMAQIESQVTKNEFSILINVEDTSYGHRLSKELRKLGFKNVELSGGLKETSERLIDGEEFNLILSSYRFSCCNEGGVRLSQKLKDVENKSKFLIIDEYCDFERNNIQKVGIDIMKCVRKEEDSDHFQESLNKIVTMYYIFNLISILFEDVDYEQCKSIWEGNPDITFYESMLNKYKFSVLSVNENRNKNDEMVSIIQKSGYDNVITSSNVEETKCAVNAKPIKLIVSEFRLDLNANADKIHDYLVDNRLDEEVDMVIIGDNMHPQVKKHIKEKGIVVIDRNSKTINTESFISFIIKGYYVMDLRKELKKVFKL